MKFSEIVGQEAVKHHLIRNIGLNRIPHAQLFVGPEGCGTLPTAIAYAQYLLCKNCDNENSGGNDACNAKFEHFAHPDLHFIYPTVTTEGVKTKPKSIDFIKDWREFLNTSIYGGLFDWYKQLGTENKQGEIRVDDSQEILRTLSLKSYEGGHKVMIIWMAEEMNSAASNKILKILEEPSETTLFILIAEKEEAIIQTIRSRCQVLRFHKLSEQSIAEALVTKHAVEENLALKIAHQAQGNFNKALKLIHEESDDVEFEKWFVLWVRAAFRAKGNAAAIHDLIDWSEAVAKLGRETQKKFLYFCIEMFRQALLINYQTPSLVYLEPKIDKFKLENFAPFVNGNNINEIYNELSNAIYLIERNGNPKIILTDLSIKLTRYLHKK